MEDTSVERKIRRRLRFIRLLNGYVPLSMTRFLIRVGNRRFKPPAGISIEPTQADDVDCDWIIPDDPQNHRVLLYFHGGGFVLGVSPLHYAMLSYIASTFKIRILSVNYRLAPEFSFPGALEDCVIAYRWLVNYDNSPQNIVMAGDSAGGNLTLTTLMQLRDDGDQLPAAAACLSPGEDFTNKAFDIDYDPLLHPRAIQLYTQLYLGENNPEDPLYSPIFGNWEGLPPILIHAGEDEILSDDAMAVKDLALKHDLDIQVKIYPRMWHVWQLYLDLPQTKHSLKEIMEFLASHLE